MRSGAWRSIYANVGNWTKRTFGSAWETSALASFFPGSDLSGAERNRKELKVRGRSAAVGGLAAHQTHASTGKDQKSSSLRAAHMLRYLHHAKTAGL